VLEQQAVRRLGATAPEPIDVRIISATNADLQIAVRQRSFREDLYHRLAVLTLRLPALRERGNDALILAERFLARACEALGAAHGKTVPFLPIRDLLRRYFQIEETESGDEAHGPVLALVGAGGIGLVLDAAINVFQWRAVAAVLVAVFAVVLVAEVAITAIRKRAL
jgi:hypothetical protein